MKFSFVGNQHLPRMVMCTLCREVVHNLMMTRHAREAHGFKSSCPEHGVCVKVEPGPRRMTREETSNVLTALAWTRQALQNPVVKSDA